MELLIGLIICAGIGGLIGNTRGQAASGVIWSLLLGPLGWLITLCLTNKKAVAREQEQQAMFAQQLAVQKQQLEAMQALSRSPAPAPPSSLRIAKDGAELGEMSSGMVKTMLKNGQLLPTDYWLDPATNEWVELELLA